MKLLTDEQRTHAQQCTRGSYEIEWNTFTEIDDLFHDGTMSDDVEVSQRCRFVPYDVDRRCTSAEGAAAMRMCASYDTAVDIIWVHTCKDTLLEYDLIHHTVVDKSTYSRKHVDDEPCDRGDKSSSNDDDDDDDDMDSDTSCELDDDVVVVSSSAPATAAPTLP